MRVPFTKMSGCGNDFVIIDHRKKFLHGKNLSTLAKEVCHRKKGVGADGLILIEDSEKSAFRWQFFNADGSVPHMCGNGARCAALYASEKNFAFGQFMFETAIGPIQASVNGDQVKVQMFRPTDLKLDFKIKVRERNVVVSFVNSGVPHVVIDGQALKGHASLIRYHKKFKEGANVNFVTKVDKHHLKVVTFERGVEDFTLACGTGAIASALVYAEKKMVENPVSVHMPGGTLTVHFTENYEEVFLEGPVDTICEGEWLWKES